MTSVTVITLPIGTVAEAGIIGCASGNQIMAMTKMADIACMPVNTIAPSIALTSTSLLPVLSAALLAV